MKTTRALGLIIVLLASLGAVEAVAAYYYSTGWRNAGEWGNAGYLYGPVSVTVDASGNVYVAERETNRISKYSPTGFWMRLLLLSTGNGQVDFPFGLAVDSKANVYVADTNNHLIQKFTSDGTFVTKWGTYGPGDGQFNNPCGVAVDPTGNVYVADAGNYRIQKFVPGKITVTSPNGGQTWTAGTAKKITWTYAGAAGTTVKIQLFTGTTLNRTIAASTSIGSAGAGSFTWPIPAGLVDGADYKIKIISIRNTDIKDMSNNNFTIVNGAP